MIFFKKFPDSRSNLVTVGIKERAINVVNGKTIIDLDYKHFRPSEVDFLRGNYSKARKQLKWTPSTTTDKLIDDMINSELSKL